MLWNWFIYYVLVGTFFDSSMWIGAYNNGKMPSPELMKATLAIYALATLVPVLSLCARRLHDLNRTAWWLLILLIPVIGSMVIYIFAALKGQQGTNKYGPAPTTVLPNELHQSSGILS